MTVRVLIVDDNAEFCVTASRLLEREGIIVAGVASTGAEALRGNEEHHPDVVLVDVDLGEENGIEVAQHLTSARRRPRVILISAHAEEDLEDLIDGSAAIGFVSKSQLSAGAIVALLDRGVHHKEPRPS